ncbi:MAG: sugar ABC transporter substrate-binding protein [Chloroflexi bacterium]|nr:sugar ABC transporter substrate-binding protein [Chloroflexota bacterium]
MKNQFKHTFSRRRFLQGAFATAGAGLLASSGIHKLFAQDEPITLVNSIRSLSNPYHSTWNLGGRVFAESVGADYVTLITEGNSERGIADIEAVLARTDGNMVLNVDPNDAPDARPIVEACVEAGAFVVSQWNKPADLHPWDFDPYYVAHISFDGVFYGRETANALFDAVGGSGGIVALGGILSNVPAIERRAGLDAALAENSDIELLDFQVANWSETEAFDIVSTWLTRFGSDIRGIWAANDSMGVGALEALRAEGLAGEVPITGIDGIQLAVEAVLAGEFAATVAWDPFWQGGMGLSIGYAAKTGVIDVSELPEENREFYGTGIIVNSENAEEFYNTSVLDVPRIEWDDHFGRATGQIEYRDFGAEE